MICAMLLGLCRADSRGGRHSLCCVGRRRGREAGIAEQPLAHSPAPPHSAILSPYGIMCWRGAPSRARAYCSPLEETEKATCAYVHFHAPR